MPEQGRVAELVAFGVLGTGPESAFDDLAGAAAAVSGCPIALVYLVDADTVWCKASYGLDVGPLPRDVTFCDHVVRVDGPVVVPDARLDPRFAGNPAVTGPPGVQFYAGFPLRTEAGAVVGTLCVVGHDARPGGLSPKQERLLTVLARQVTSQLELRRAVADRDGLVSELSLAAERYRLLSEQATDVVSQHLPDGTTLYVSPSIRAVLGHDPAAEVGRSATDRVHPEDAPAMMVALTEVRDGEPATATVRARHADGSWRHLEIRVSPVTDETGQVVQVHSVSRDVTDRVAAQEQVRLSEERFRVLFDANPVGQVELGADGVIRRVNQAFADLVGVPDRGFLVGLTPDWATAAADIPSQGEALRAAAAEPGTVLRTERTVVRTDGTEVEMAGTLVGVAGDDGHATVLIGTVIDVTERNEAQRRLNELARELAAARDDAVRRAALTETVLDTVGVGIVACDAEGHLTLFNSATRLFHGIPADPDADPMDFANRYALYAEDGITLLAPDRVPLVRALTEGSVEDAVIVIAPDGLPSRVVRCDGRATRDPDGRLLGAVVVMTDITDARAAARDLAEQAEFTRVLLETAHSAIWACDTTGKPTYVNATAREVLGWPSLDELTALHDSGLLQELAASVRLLRPDGQPLAEQERPLGRALAGEHTGEVEVVIAAQDRPRRTMLLQASPLHDAAGAVSGAMLSGHDVTALRASEARFRAAFHDGPTPVARLGRDGTVQDANPALRRLLAQRTAALVGGPLGRHVAQEDRDRFGRVLSGSGTGAEPVEIRLARADGSLIWCEFATTLTTDVDGAEFVLAQFLDVHARKEQELLLEQAAQRDPLTLLGNRSQLHARVADVLATGPDVTAGVLFIDLDGFKDVNDTHGHDAGDAVLVEVAARLAAAVRPEDTVLRLGGDEFVVVCQAPPAQAAAVLTILAERLSDGIAAPVPFRGRTLTVGASIGTAIARPGQSPEDLVDAADRDMYRRKHGRARERRARATIDGRDLRA